MAAITKSAAYSLRAISRPIARQSINFVRNESSTTYIADKGAKGETATDPSTRPGGTAAESGMVSQESAKQAQPKHAPDYAVQTDYRIS